MKKRVMLAAVLSISLVVAGWMIYDSQARQLEKVQVSRVEYQDVTTRVETTGVVEPEQVYNIMPEVGGQITRIYVKEGQNVKKGENLMHIDSSAVEGQLQQAQLAMEMEREATETVEKETARQKAEMAVAMAQGPGTDYNQFNDAMEAYRNASSEEEDAAAALSSSGERLGDRNVQDKKLQLAEMKVKELERQMERFVLHSAIQGKVLSINAKEGEVAAPGMPVMMVGDTRRMVVRAMVSENDLLRVKPGQTVEISGDTVEGSLVKGRVTRVKPIASRVQSAQGMEAYGEVEVQPEKNALKTVPGVTVNVNIICQSKEKARAVPVEALVEKNGKEYVFIQEEDRVYLRKVGTGVRSDFYVEIREGLDIGDKVVFDPETNLQDGARVRVVD